MARDCDASGKPPAPWCPTYILVRFNRTRLEELPFVKHATIGADGTLVLQTPKGRHRFRVEQRGGRLGYVVANAIIAAARDSKLPTIVLAPYIPAPMARHLAAQGLQFVDAEGNCRLSLGEAYVATVEGRRASAPLSARRPLRAAGYQALFALLARPELAGRSVREVALAAGVGKSAVAELVGRLKEEGKLVGNRLRLDRDLRERWLQGYVEVLRPRWLVTRLHPRLEEPAALERLIEEQLQGTTWGFGGTAAAMRLTGHYRGAETVVHLAEVTPDLGARLQALPDANGPLMLLRTPCPIAFESDRPHTVHPLLVYAELLASADERARETAADVMDSIPELAG